MFISNQRVFYRQYDDIAVDTVGYKNSIDLDRTIGIGHKES